MLPPAALPTPKITLTQGYEAMLHFLNNYYILTGSTDVTDILSGAEYIADAKPADSAFWEYWMEAFNTLEKKGPLTKVFDRD